MYTIFKRSTLTKSTHKRPPEFQAKVFRVRLEPTNSNWAPQQQQWGKRVVQDGGEAGEVCGGMGDVLHRGLCGTTLSSVAMTVAHAVVVEAACRSTVRQPPTLLRSLFCFFAPSHSICGAGFEIYLGSFSLSPSLSAYSLYFCTRCLFGQRKKYQNKKIINVIS